jgi:hypothetical protein
MVEQGGHRLFLTHATLLLVRAKKSRIVDHALTAFYNSDQAHPIPDVSKDKHTLAGKRTGRGWEHFSTEGTLLNDGEGELSHAPHLPDNYLERAMAATVPPHEQARLDDSEIGSH